MSADLENQDLDSLLSKLCQTNSDSYESLDRENIHFHICDNLITFFEKIKFNHMFSCKFKQGMGQSINQEINQDVIDENSFGPISYSSSFDSSTKEGEENDSDLEMLETTSKPSTNSESGLFSVSETMSLSNDSKSKVSFHIGFYLNLFHFQAILAKMELKGFVNCLPLQD